MTNLKNLLKLLSIYPVPACPPDLEIDSVTDDSRQCGPGSLFVAIQGAKADGHQFLADVAARGTRVALVGRSGLAAPDGLTLLRVENPRRTLSLIAHELQKNPSHQMKVVGVTGTNGKTTTTYLLESIFRAAGLVPGVIGTIEYRWKDQVVPAPQTTPSPVELAEIMGRMRRDGVDVIAMEISSHALDQHRCDGVFFQAAALTNLTQDHLDYHGTMEEYSRAKERLFTEVLPANPRGTAVLNLDDPAGRQYATTTHASRSINYSLCRAEADLRVETIRMHQNGMDLQVVFNGEAFSLNTPMYGLFNAANCLTATGLALGMGLPIGAIQEGIAAMTGAPGRFEIVRAGQPFPIIVDYAHTPDALLQVLLHARGLSRRRLIAVFGCGGDRDPGKRPLMGEAAARLADDLIITNDNPRTEEPHKIADSILEGAQQRLMAGQTCRVVLDRREAIQAAIAMADARDAILIAGKGHEDYQILGKTKIHFDDREVAREAVGRRN